MMRFAVVSVNRRTGNANTVRVHEDSVTANRQAGRLERSDPEYRYTVVPFLSSEEKND